MKKHKILKTLKTDKTKSVLLIMINNVKYILKIDAGNINESDINEKELLDYLKEYVNVPLIKEMGQLDNNSKYKIYTFTTGNLNQKINYENTNICCKNVYMMYKKLQSYSKNSNYPFGNIDDKLTFFRDSCKNDSIKRIIINLQNDNYFKLKINSEKAIIIHDDLHRGNILWNKKNIGIIDFEGLKRYPQTMQLASFITLFGLLEDYKFNYKDILDLWPDKIDLKYLNQLILFRLLKAYNYFELNSVDKENEWRKKIIIKRIYEWSEKLWKKQDI